MVQEVQGKGIVSRFDMDSFEFKLEWKFDNTIILKLGIIYLSNVLGH
jgi:hypothetical protein